MKHIEDIIKAIQNGKNSNQRLSNKDILNILSATKGFCKDAAFIDSLIGLHSRLTLPETNDNKKKLLTKREKQILNLIGFNKVSSEIATELELKNSTIETHKKNIRKKLGLKGKGKLFEYAILNNMRLNVMSLK